TAFLVLVLALVAGALLLRAACALCRVKAPRFGKALGIVVLVGVVNAIANACVYGVLYLVSGPRAGELLPSDSLFAIPLGILLSAGIYQAYFEVTLGRGILIRLAEFGITAAITLVVCGSIYLVWLGKNYLETAHLRPENRKAQARKDTRQGERAL